MSYMEIDKGHAAIGHQGQKSSGLQNSSSKGDIDFALEKSIFSNVFERDIRKVYFYKKAERLARAITLIAPAFSGSPVFKSRFETIALGLIDSVTLDAAEMRPRITRELLTLSSLLAIVQSSRLLSPMNCELISREAQLLLQEIASYEEPHIFLVETPSLATLMRSVHRSSGTPHLKEVQKEAQKRQDQTIKDTKKDNKSDDRKNIILSLIAEKGKVSIKDISLSMRNISEKTIQRELVSLIRGGVLIKEGERRWSTYALLKQAT